MPSLGGLHRNFWLIYCKDGLIFYSDIKDDWKYITSELRIEGVKKLNGEVKVGGAKNLVPIQKKGDMNALWSRDQKDFDSYQANRAYTKKVQNNTQNGQAAHTHGAKTTHKANTRSKSKICAPLSFMKVSRKQYTYVGCGRTHTWGEYHTEETHKTGENIYPTELFELMS